MNRDTDMGGRAGRFPDTRGTIVGGLVDADPAVRERAVAALVDAYWKPVYKVLRVRHGKDNEDAKDLTQAFFADALERGTLAKFDGGRARFRTFLRVCLDAFAANDARARAAQKRGGGVEHVALDRIADADFAGADAELRAAASAGQGAPASDAPDPWFEAEWRRSLLAAAVADLERECIAGGVAHRFTLFRRYALERDDGQGAAPPTYAVLARELGIAPTDVTNGLAAARRAFRRLVLARVRAQAATEDEFQADLRALLGRAADAAQRESPA